MASTDVTPEPKGMKIAQLSRESGLTRSTIHHYVNIGLLHRPRQAGLNVHLFDETHLDRLRQIRGLRESEGLPLAEIKDLLERAEPADSGQRGRDNEAESRTEVDSSNRDGEGRVRDQGRRNREMILDTAIRLFSERGYENTTISDITEAMHIGKGTFYGYFKNKRELFMECIDRLTVTIVPREAWAEIRSEQGYEEKTRKRGAAFLDAFPGFRGILNMLRVCLGSRDPILAGKAKDAFTILAAPMAKDLRRAIAHGVVRPDVDVKLFAFLQLCLAESLGYWRMMDSRYSVQDGVDTLIEVFGQGMANQGEDIREPDGPRPRCGEVCDRKGVKTRLVDISVNGGPCLPGKVGEAQVELDLPGAKGVDFAGTGSKRVATATMRDGSRVVLEVDGETNLSGRASFGSFCIPLKSIENIRFEGSTDSNEA